MVALFRTGGTTQQLSSFLGYTEDHGRRVWECGTTIGMILVAPYARDCEYITSPGVRSTPGLTRPHNPDPKMKNVFAVLAVLSAQLVAAHCKRSSVLLPYDVLTIDGLIDTFPDLIANGTTFADWVYVRETENHYSNGPVCHIDFYAAFLSLIRRAGAGYGCDVARVPLL